MVVVALMVASVRAPAERGFSVRNTNTVGHHLAFKRHKMHRVGKLPSMVSF